MDCTVKGCKLDFCDDWLPSTRFLRILLFAKGCNCVIFFRWKGVNIGSFLKQINSEIVLGHFLADQIFSFKLKPEILLDIERLWRELVNIIYHYFGRVCFVVVFDVETFNFIPYSDEERWHVDLQNGSNPIPWRTGKEGQGTG